MARTHQLAALAGGLILALVGASSAQGAAQQAKPNYAAWGLMPHKAEGKGTARAQARTRDGQFIAAPAIGAEIDPQRFYVAGMIWNAESGELSTVLLDAEAKRTVGKANGADGVVRSHRFTRIGAGAAINNPGPRSFFEGQVAEILVFSRDLSEQQQSQVEGYLVTKHLKAGAEQAPQLPVKEGLILQLDAANVSVENGRATGWPDGSGRDNAAKVAGAGPAVAPAATPARGPAVTFDGKGYFEVPSKPEDFDGARRSIYAVFRTGSFNGGRIINGGYESVGPAGAAAAPAPPQTGLTGDLKRLRYNHPGLTVDLGVGLWGQALPYDYDDDGTAELMMGWGGKPYPGVNIYRRQGGPESLVFKFVSEVARDVGALNTSYTNGQWFVTSFGSWYPRFRQTGTAEPVSLPFQPAFYVGTKRLCPWRLYDYDADGTPDLLIAAYDARDYGWDDAFDAKGNWANGQQRGFFYWARNSGTLADPKFEQARQIKAGDQPMQVLGLPSINFADFNGDKLPDLISGDGLDFLTFFQNVGTGTEPRFAAGKPLTRDGQVIRLDLEMITPAAMDYDADGDMDLIVGEEDGRVELLRNSGRVSENVPLFEPPVFLQQHAEELKAGALTTPFGFDLDGDGDDDLLCGNTAGYVCWFENLGRADGSATPKWSAPRYIEADGKVIRIVAGPNGSIQGPAEAKWGYTTVCAADWDVDGLPDLLVNSIWGKVVWYRNVGSRSRPRFAAARPVDVESKTALPKPQWNWWSPQGKELVVQWRTSVQAIDLTRDGLPDLVAIDDDGYLAMYERARSDGGLKLLPARRVFHVEPGKPNGFDPSHVPLAFDENQDGKDDQLELDAKGRLGFHYRVPGTPGMSIRWVDRAGDERYRDPELRNALRLNTGWAGRSGRRKFVLTDWDGDGRTDLLVNSVNASFLRNVSDDPRKIVLRDMGPVDSLRLAGHDTCPAAADLDRDGSPDLVLGAEDGFFYHLPNPHAASRTGG